MVRSGSWAPGPHSRPTLPSNSEREAIVAACDAFIANVLKPRFLPQVRPTQWNYVVDIYGKWAAGRYRFIQRYRSGREDNLGWEFEAPFTRFDYIAAGRFDIYWMRSTGKWWRLYEALPLAASFERLLADELLHPN